MKPIGFFIFISFLVFGISSCSSGDNFVGEEGAKNEPPTMRIFLSLDTRATSPGEDFEEGVGYENFIDLYDDNYRIYFFSSDDNTFIDVFHTVLHPSLSQENENLSNGLVFNGYLFPEIGTKFKMVVLANWSSYPVVADADDSVDSDLFALVKGKTTIRELTTHVGSQFNALTTPAQGSNWLGKGRLMPFYGVRSFDLTQSHPDLLDNDGKVLSGKIVDLSDNPIPLLRAMAKVEVLFDHPYASFESVEMSRVNEKGFSAPYKDNDADSWDFDYSDYYSESGGWSGNYKRGVHLVSGSEVSTLAFTKVSDRIVNNDGSVSPEKWVAYVPEYSNKTDSPASIIVKLKQSSVIGGSGGEDRLRSEFYFTSNGLAPSEGSYAPDIERNNIYRFKIGMDGASVDIQPYTAHNVRFEFGLVRDARGDLMVLKIPKRDSDGNIVVENGDTVMTYPQYFLDFIGDDNPKHKFPKEEDEHGNPTTGHEICLEDGDYYAIVVGEDEAMSNAEVWVKDREGCRVLSNFGSEDSHSQECMARLVELFFGNNQSEKFYKDIFGFRRVYHFENHNSIVIHPELSNMLFCMVENFQQENQSRKYYEVESWDEDSHTGWIINNDNNGKEVGFQKITSEGVLGESVDLDGNPLTTND
ncbi:MAG: hypothetical protein K2G77_02905 [Muribaculaceae bacterium]|nr:hypothetical protein [Muribaculaceae bacterium]